MQLSEICKKMNLMFEGRDFKVTALNTLKNAQPNEMSFIDNDKYISQLSTTKAGAVLIKKGLVPHLPKNCTAVIAEETYLQLAYISKLFAKKPIGNQNITPIIEENSFVSPKAHLGSGVIIGENCTILEGASIGENVKINDNTTIYSNVSIYYDCVIGSDCIIHSGAVIGSDGFGFAHTKEGRHVKIYQNGNVVIGDDVEVGANCTIDRGVFNSTIIGKNCKIDNLVQIAHNVILDEGVIIVAQAGISGSTQVGQNCVFGGQVGAAGHLKIAPFTTISARSGVSGDVKKSGVYSGYPLLEHKKWLRLQAKIKSLLKP